MDYVLNVMGVICTAGIVGFLFFGLRLTVLGLSIRKRLRESEYQSDMGYSPKTMLEQTPKQSKLESKFFSLGEWPDIEDPEIVSDLKKQYKVKRLMNWSAVTFGVGYVGYMGVNAIIHFYFSY